MQPVFNSGRSRESGIRPAVGMHFQPFGEWIPAFAGMTLHECDDVWQTSPALASTVLVQFAVAAVYDRRNRLQLRAGGHRPPLQQVKLHHYRSER